MANLSTFDLSQYTNVRSLLFDGHLRHIFYSDVRYGLMENLGRFNLSQRTNVSSLFFNGHFRHVRYRDDM